MHEEIKNDKSEVLSPRKSNSLQKKSRNSMICNSNVRKFPGPAGFSPDLCPGEIEKLLLKESGLTGISNNAVLLSSKYSNLLLSKPCYQKLIQDFGLNKQNNPLNDVTLQVVSKAFKRKLKRDLKVPFLGVLVSNIYEEHGVSLKLMDPTYEVNAVMQKDIWEEIGGDLEVNTVFALMQVPVIASCTARPPITLFISKKNVLSIYSESKKGEPEVKTLNVVSETELRKNCVDWLTQMGVNMSSSAKSPATRSMSIPSSSVSSDSNSSGQSSNVNFEWNPDKILTDLDFDVNDFAESIEPPLKTFNFRENSNPESFACKRAKFDVSPEKSEPEKENDSKFSQSQSSPRRVGTQVQDLSPSEKLMVQEVLNGINFDDFEN